ncbi:hypothetical protein HHI36_001039 [Cryptolaemus montrouzieri]|uniref:Uncharacterized protein n=1 Tax=Cryptolaemus montrouzieri TaxID=559131 RepID=A0ABD2P677_9CUCU
MSRNKRLTERQLIEYAEKCFDIEEEDKEPFMESCSEYEQSSGRTSEPSTSEKRNGNKIQSSKNEKRTGESNEDSSSTESLSDENDDTEPTNVPIEILDTWKPVDNNFVPRMKIPNEKPCSVIATLNKTATELDVFFKLFPKSLFI